DFRKRRAPAARCERLTYTAHSARCRFSPDSDTAFPHRPPPGLGQEIALVLNRVGAYPVVLTHTHPTLGRRCRLEPPLARRVAVRRLPRRASQALAPIRGVASYSDYRDARRSAGRMRRVRNPPPPAGDAARGKPEDTHGVQAHGEFGDSQDRLRGRLPPPQ